MSSFKDLCLEYFGSSDLYEVLEVERDATEKQIKKAYHKVSLRVHPDRVEESEKEIATEKFKVLGRIHAVLQDEDKRKCYDDSGEVDEESDTEFNWMEYWRGIFKKIERKDIENYEKTYIGSDVELRDIKKSYVNSKGNMDLMLELIPFSNCDSEPRIIEIVRQMVDDGEVEEYKSFFNESKQKKNRRKSKWAREKEMSEKIDTKTLEQEIAANSEKRLKGFCDMISDIESRYSGGGKKRKSLTSGAPPAKKRATRSKK